ncbi:MAG: dephospho-CoA kinase [Pseudomonadota bacterium]|nr:MAG: dephospho-CoA kinase [Pseudomonadota bacterium]
MSGPRLRRIGLTGGIASGKSEVSRLLARKGIPVIDADRLAREAVAPGSPALLRIAERWPETVRDGRLDRKALGAIVFASAAERKALEAIVHPWIRAEAWRRMDEALARGAKRVIYEAPLLFETGTADELDAVILVAAPEEVQRQRLMRRDALRPEEAEARIAAQLPLEEKRRRATFVIDNDGDLDDLSRKVDALWERIEACDPGD